MGNIITQTIKATIIKLIVALFIVIIIVFGVNLSVGAQINETISLTNKVAVIVENNNPIPETVITEENKLKNYPEYGTQYATIEIPKIDINLPVYYGDTLELLKNGVGHTAGSFFPGEGGTVIYMGHNSKKVFRRFSELQLGNEITVKTSYGEYKYSIYDMQIIDENDTEKLPIQEEKEILMIYTCYPFNNIGYTTQRYVVYAELEK